MTELMKPGKKLLAAAFNQILLHPETWNQQSWHCGTSHCFGGWCQVLVDGEQEDTNYDEDEYVALKTQYAICDLLEECGVCGEYFDYITDPLRTMTELYNAVHRILFSTNPRLRRLEDVRPFDLEDLED